MTDNIYRWMLHGWTGASWIKGAFESRIGDQHCLAGRARLVVGGAINCHPPPMPELKRVILEQYPERVNLQSIASSTISKNIWGTADLDPLVITAFNDHPDTTFADIWLVTEKAAALHDEEVQ